ncbi:MAG TPA: helix-turn-helix domain-containing protein [Longimicrobium sp.]|jgi:transcriptional regulator with XRE-family HTH domain
MEREGRTRGAGGILRRRYVGGNASRAASVERERANAEIAQLIHDRRTTAGLTQKQLAELIGTRQSVISRLEDADYDGHSLSMLQRVAEALEQKVQVRMTPADPEAGTIRFAFREIMRGLRKRKGLTLDELADRIGADREELAAMERQEGYQPSPHLLDELSRFYELPQRKLAALAGAVSGVEPALREQASRFAAQLESFAKLSAAERRTVDEFVSFLKTSP